MWIKRAVFILAIVSWFPAISMAYTITLEDGTVLEESSIETGNTSTQYVYGPLSVSYTPQEIVQISLKEEKKSNPISLISMVGVAEAAPLPSDIIVEDYFKSYRAIQGADELRDIEGAVDPSYYSILEQKADSGVSEIVILELVRNMLPEQLEVVDVHVDEQVGKIALKGVNATGPVQGIVTMNNDEGQWVTKNEQWYAKSVNNASSIPPMAYIDESAAEENSDRFFLRDNEYYFDNNWLALQKPNGYRRKSAFMLYFYMIKEEKEEVSELGEIEKKPDLHIAFSGPRAILAGDNGQSRYKDKYPMDVSIAKDKDGYIPNTFNLHLPKKKPNEVCTGFMMNF